MYDELVKRLRELQAITEHCDEQSCDECENRELCDKHDNKTLSGTYKEAADAIEELSKPKWIPVTERLPSEEGFTLIFTAHGHAGVCYFTNGWWGGYDKDGITHWMPLPEPPKEE